MASFDGSKCVAELSACITTALAAEMAANSCGKAQFMRQHMLLRIELYMASTRVGY